jgi:hypothetical protein
MTYMSILVGKPMSKYTHGSKSLILVDPQGSEFDFFCCKYLLWVPVTHN